MLLNTPYALRKLELGFTKLLMRNYTQTLQSSRDYVISHRGFFQWPKY